MIAPGQVVHFHYLFDVAGAAGATAPLQSGAQGDAITLTFHYTMLEAGAGAVAIAAPCVLTTRTN